MNSILTASPFPTTPPKADVTNYTVVHYEEFWNYVSMYAWYVGAPGCECAWVWVWVYGCLCASAYAITG